MIRAAGGTRDGSEGKKTSEKMRESDRPKTFDEWKNRFQGAEMKAKYKGRKRNPFSEKIVKQNII